MFVCIFMMVIAVTPYLFTVLFQDDDVILDSPSNIYASPMHKGEDDDDVFSDGQSNIGTQTPYTKQ